MSGVLRSMLPCLFNFVWASCQQTKFIKKEQGKPPGSADVAATAVAGCMQAATTAAVSMVPVGDGMSAPADVIIAAQLAEYGIHPKQLAWVLQVCALCCSSIAGTRVQMPGSVAPCTFVHCSCHRSCLLDRQQTATYQEQVLGENCYMDTVATQQWHCPSG